MAAAPFRVGVTRDIRRTDGSPVHDLTLLDGGAGVEWEFLAEDVDEISPEAADRYDGLVVFSPAVTARTVAAPGRLVLVARLGVGYDRVDVDSCTAGGVMLTITPDGVRRPMASGTMAFLLALAHRLPWKDDLARAVRWERFSEVGQGLMGRTLGLIGLGNVARDLCGLAAPWGMRIVASDPYAADPPAGVELVPLERLLTEADFVVVACPLNEKTHHLLDAERIALMKQSAYLVNIARGPIVDQVALVDALQGKRIRGAALDVFEREPVDPDEPLLRLDNVILAPHSIGLTDELFRGCGRSACEAVLAVARGHTPHYVVNPRALEHPRLRGRLA